MTRSPLGSVADGASPFASLEADRELFPTLRDRAYFASQCLGPFPEEMLEDLAAYRRSLTLRSRSLGEWVERYQEMHALTEALLGARAGTVFLRDSATAVQATIAAALSPSPARNRILVGASDFSSSRYLWSAQKERGFDVVEIDDSPSREASAFVSQIDERVAVVATSLVSPVNGGLTDAAAIGAAASAAGALFVLDVYQAIGVVPVDVNRLGADLVAGGYHKWLGGGGTGLAFGWASSRVLETLPTALPGWLAHRDLPGFHGSFVPAPTARRFAQGMVAMEPVYTSRAGLKWVLSRGAASLRAASEERTRRITSRALEAGLEVTSPRETHKRGGMVTIRARDPQAIVASLSELGFDIDARPLAGVRVGPHPTCSIEACDAVVEAISTAIAKDRA
ncbi:MAG: aminotransferase class V-fold PLP-dependent enzyme [Polyangiaceae bacterium]